MKIDFHVHYDGSDEYLDAHLAKYESMGVVSAVIFGDNDACLQASKEHPEALVPFVFWNWDTDTPEHVGGYADRGFRGVKFILPHKPYDDGDYFPVYEQLEKHGLIALFHTAVISGYKPERQRKIRTSSLDMRPGLLDRIARCFPELIIVGAHMGYPWYNEACSMMRWHKNIYFDTSTCQLTATRPKYMSEGPAESVKPQIRDFYLSGDLHPEKLLWGTDAVLDREKGVGIAELSVRQHEVAFDDLAASTEVRENIYFSTANRLLAR